MLKLSQLSHVLLATLVSISFAKTVNAEPTATLNVVVNGIHHKKGEICFRVYANEKGFPMSSTSEAQSGCAKINGTSVKKEFSGLNCRSL